MGLFEKKAKELAAEQSYNMPPPPDMQLPPLPPPPMYGSGLFTDGIPLGMQEKDTSKELAEYITSTKELLADLENQLRGRKSYQEWDENTQSLKEIYEDIGEPMMNRLGIQRFIGFLGGMVSKNSIMSNLDSKFLHRLMIEENEIISSHLSINKKRYDIRDTDYQIIVDLAENLVYTCMTRGVDRGEGQLVLKGRREVVSRNIDDAAMRAYAAQNQSLWQQFGGRGNYRQ